MLLERRSRPIRGVRVVCREAAPFGLQVVPSRMLTTDEVLRTLERLPDTDGPIVTSALSTIEQDAFRQVGFVDRESLHLLRHDFARRPTSRNGARVRGARRGDLDTILEIDRRSFDEFWSLDRAGILSARRATPAHRYVVATLDGRLVGYAITGVAGTASFLQRLAVHPDSRSAGIATKLVSDAIDWALRRSALYMMVNTQTSNDAAFSLYTKLGFTVQNDQLKVLEWPH